MDAVPLDERVVQSTPTASSGDPVLPDGVPGTSGELGRTQPAAPLPADTLGDATGTSVAHGHVLDTLSALDDVHVTVDAGWPITHANLAAAALLQRPRAALGGRELWTVMDRDAAIVALTERVMGQRSAARIETDDERLGGWVEFRAHPLPDGGLALQVRDIDDIERAADSSPNDIERRARDALAVAKRRRHGSVVDGRSVQTTAPA